MKLRACQRYIADNVPEQWEACPIKKRIWLEYGDNLIGEERNPGPFAVYGSNGIVGTHEHFMVEGPGILIGRKGSVGAVYFSESHFWPIDTVYLCA